MSNTNVKDVVAALRTHSAFAECSLADLDHLAKRSQQSSVPAAWPLIHELTPADACYVILEGAADVVIKGARVATLRAGAVVGETGLALRKLRNASVISTTPLRLLNIDATTFADLIAKRPAIKAVLLARTQATTTSTA